MSFPDLLALENRERYPGMVLRGDELPGSLSLSFEAVADARSCCCLRTTEVLPCWDWWRACLA